MNLPFDPSEIADNLRQERHTEGLGRSQIVCAKADSEVLQPELPRTLPSGLAPFLADQQTLGISFFDWTKEVGSKTLSATW